MNWNLARSNVMGFRDVDENRQKFHIFILQM